MSAFNWQKGETGLCWSIVCSSAEVWQRLEKIMTGQTSHLHAKQMIPKSSHHLNSMAKIPQESLLQWLDEVIAGEQEMKWFKDKCTSYKAELAIWTSLSNWAREFTLCSTDEVHVGDSEEDIARWRDNLTDMEVSENIKAMYPTLSGLVSDFAWADKGKALSSVPSGTATSQMRQFLTRERANLIILQQEKVLLL